MALFSQAEITLIVHCVTALKSIRWPLDCQWIDILPPSVMIAAERTIREREIPGHAPHPGIRHPASAPYHVSWEWESGQIVPACALYKLVLAS